MMRLKFLDEGAIGPYSKFAWPTPTASSPGAWVEAGAEPSPCARGVHACDVEALSIWLAPELWLVELGGAVTTARHKLVAERGRLVARVEGWDAPTRRAFAEAAVMRARDLARGALDAPNELDLAAALAEARDPSEVARALGDRRGGARDASLALGYLADAITFIDIDVSASAFCAAHAALDEEGFWRERAWQSRWIAERLDLARLVSIRG